MPRLRKALERYQHEILAWHRAGDSYTVIQEKIHQQCSLDVGIRTLKTTLKEWGASRYKRPPRSEDDLRKSMIAYYFYKNCANEYEISAALQKAGVPTER